MGNGGSREHLLLLFIARLMVSTKVLKLCGSKNPVYKSTQPPTHGDIYAHTW